MKNPTPNSIEDDKNLCKELRTVSNMINMGEKIQWARETTLMDRAADRIEALISHEEKVVARVLAVMEEHKNNRKMYNGEMISMIDRVKLLTLPITDEKV